MPKPGMPVQSKILTADGQVTTTGKKGWLYGYKMKSDTLATEISFQNGAGGTELDFHSTGATTAEGDNCEVVTYGDNPIPFSVDIYVDVGTSPKVEVRYIEDITVGA